VTHKKINGLFWLFLASQLLIFNANADTPSDPKDDPYLLLSLIDRPNASDSAWAVPDNMMVVEAGYQFAKLLDATYLQNAPQALVRFGLPHSTELVALLPNYVFPSPSGFTASVVGLKHEFVHTKKTVISLEGLITPKSGSAEYGSAGTGGAFNGILSYDVIPEFNITTMVGVTSFTTSQNAGGDRYGSFNPDLVLTLVPRKDINIYGEVYGQTKTGPGQGSGYNTDFGIIYLARRNIAFDAEVGQRLTGELGFDKFVGGGVTFLFS